MSANYYGATTVACYDDCRQSGCPRHHIRLIEKHGGLYVEELVGDHWQNRVDIPLDLRWVEAVARLMAIAHTPVEEVERKRAELEMTLRAVRAELIADGYAPPNEMLRKIDEALEP